MLAEQGVAVCGALGEDRLELPPRLVVASFPGQHRSEQDAGVAVSGRHGDGVLQQRDGFAALARDRKPARPRHDIALSGVELSCGAHHHHQHRTDSRLSPEGHRGRACFRIRHTGVHAWNMPHGAETCCAIEHTMRPASGHNIWSSMLQTAELLRRVLVPFLFIGGSLLGVLLALSRHPARRS